MPMNIFVSFQGCHPTTALTYTVHSFNNKSKYQMIFAGSATNRSGPSIHSWTITCDRATRAAKALR